MAKVATFKEKAKKLGIDTANLTKEEAIRTIQIQEGYSACFSVGKADCEYSDCCWRKECIPG
jgi:hypothetical protein